jgi:hypothetical protein
MAWVVRLGVIERNALFEVLKGRGELSEMKQDQSESMMAIQQAHGVLQALRQIKALLCQRVCSP